MPSKSCFSCATSCFAREHVSDLHEQVQKNHIKPETGTQPSFAIFGQAQSVSRVRLNQARFNFVGAYAKARDDSNNWFFSKIETT